MDEIICEVINQKGMHARAAAQIVELVNQYQASAILVHQMRKAPADSLIRLLTLDAPKGSQILIKCQGKEAKALSLAIQNLFSAGFGESS